MRPLLNGRQVVISPLLGAQPKICIPESFEWCTDAFRAEHNKWLLDRFGATEDRMYICEASNTLYISPGRARALNIR